MRICYVVLSPTFGMHQYTADLANRFAGSYESGGHAPAEVTVIAPSNIPHARYAPQVTVQPIVKIEGTGLKLSNLNLRGLRRVYQAIVAARPDVVHFSGPHIWNPLLLWLLRRGGYRTIHTIHDLDPHSGSGYGQLLYAWNNTIKHWSGHILVHSEGYRTRLIAQGVPTHQVTYSPLLHLFVNYASEILLGEQFTLQQLPQAAANDPFILFFARLEAYKGIQVLIEAMRQLNDRPAAPRIQAVIAGKGDIQQFTTGPLPENVELRNRLIADPEAIDLFSRCSVVVLPYIDATQSALIAAAYFFGKPVIVTRVGALPEYVIEGKTGWLIEPLDPQGLAACLQEACGDPTRLARMGQAGRHWYETQRQIERRTLCLMYERVCNERDASLAPLEQASGGSYVDR